jgi:isoleucyl-tRNA synthetase
MNDTPAPADYSTTLFLPRTDFPMRAGLPQREPAILARWDAVDLYRALRRDAAGRPKYVLHDGPPYANANIHIGTGLNKILKDVVVRSFQMRGYDANYVPGWDCHGLPIEWKIEEEYRARGRNKDGVPVNEFRRQCREFAARWIKVQSEEFKRLGVVGDFDDPYTTMSFHAEARIAGELMKFAMSGQLYRGSKPVMWSVVEKTALAEAEIEYQDYQSDTVWVKFPVKRGPASLLAEHYPDKLNAYKSASIVIWTTTPWTIPGNRAIAYSPNIAYGLYEVTASPEGNWAKVGERFILADSLAVEVFKTAKVEGFRKLYDAEQTELELLFASHPLAGRGYDFKVPLLAGEHVTAEAGTGFVHTAPGHGREDFDLWTENARFLNREGIDPAIPFTVDPEGRFTSDAPGFEGRRVITEKGEKGDANQAVIEALVAAGMLIARGRLKHQYPHSWRSKKPVIFRNTPQWFVHMDRDIGDGTTLRQRALAAVDETRFVPQAGQNRLRAMIEGRPDWVLSRQRAWGVPITIFVDRETGELLRSAEVNDRITAAFEAEGADAWFAEGAKERFLSGAVADLGRFEMVTDILDVWFDSGSTHAFVLEDRPDLRWPADLYLEGSDQHRGWFQSSLLESCGTRGRAPYDAVVTHGFVVDEDGRKMSKSLGNTVTPQEVIAKSGADILRLWVVSSDYAEDLRIGPEILKNTVESYRKIRNTLRWMLGTLAHFTPADVVDFSAMPDLERLILSRLAALDAEVRAAYDAFDFKRITAALGNFMTVELSAYYFDIRKDALYCDPISSVRRRAALTVIDRLFERLVKWLAPFLPFTMEEAWGHRHGEDAASVHLQQFPATPESWRDEALERRWDAVWRVRSVMTGALERERAGKRIGSSLEAAPEVHVADPELLAALDGIDLAEIAITSAADLIPDSGPPDAFRLPEVAGVAVVARPARGRKCARSWKITEEVGSDPEYPDVTPRDAEALREWQAAQRITAA